MAGALFLLVAAAAWSQETVYVKVKDAPVRSGTAATDSVVATLTKGAALTVVAKEGTRYKVKLSTGQEGYISRLHVSDTQPSDGSGALSGLGRSDVQANEAQMVSSIRGLSPAAKRMAEEGKDTQKYVKWAEQMETESAKITPAEVKNFLQTGGIGL